MINDRVRRTVAVLQPGLFLVVALLAWGCDMRSGQTRPVVGGSAVNDSARATLVAAIEEVFGANLPEDAVADNWAILGGKDPSFVFRVRMTRHDWEAATEAASLVKSHALPPTTGSWLPTWARAVQQNGATPGELWTSTPVNYADLRCWIVQEEADQVYVVGYRHSTVNKLPMKVYQLAD